MSKQVNFFDGAQSSTVPTIGNVDTTALVQYADDATFEAANAGSPVPGNIYFNTTSNIVRYYNGTEWTDVLDDSGTQTLQNKTIDGTSATGNNTVTADADDISYDNTSSSLTATDAQAAIDEVESRLDTAEASIVTNASSGSDNASDIADLRTTTGTVDGDTDMGTFSGTVISDNVTTKTALQELETALEALGSPLDFQGTWDADTNTPTLTSGSGTQGHFYIVNVAGSTNLDGISNWNLNDWAVYDGTAWRQIDNSEVVTSVNGQTGAVSIALDDVSDVEATGPSIRDYIRRNLANTAWEAFDPNSVADDTATGSNAVLAAVNDSVVRLTNASLVSIDEISAGHDGQQVVLVNATTVPLLVNNNTGATTANRILTGTGAEIELLPDANLIVVYDATTAKWRIVGGTGSGGGGVQGIVSGNNSTFDATIGDWVSYADAAGSLPVDGTGGSPNITVVRTSTLGEVQNGKGSLKVSKGAFDRQGEGISLDLEVPRYLRGQSSLISFSYEQSGGFTVGTSSDVKAYLYDVTNSAILTPTDTQLDGSGSFREQVTIPSTCEDIRIILHIATTSATAWDLILDNVELKINDLSLSSGIDSKVLFRAFKNGGSTTANVAVSAFTTVQKDTHGAFNATTGEFTVPSAGDYFFSSQFRDAGGLSGYTTRFVVNGVDYALGNDSDGGFRNNTITTIIYDLDYGDVVTVEVTKSMTLDSLSTNNYFECFKIGAATNSYAPQVAYLKDVKSNGTAGGGFTSGAWQTRTLNTEEGNASFVALSANQMVIEPGQYEIEVHAQAFAVSNHKAKLRDVTNSVDVLIGQNHIHGASGSSNASVIVGSFTVTATTNFEIQHRCSVTNGAISNQTNWCV